MSTPKFDSTFNNPTTLRIISLLSSSQKASFTYIKETLGIADSNLSKQMTKLIAKKYVKSDRAHKGRGALTFYEITKTGRQALKQHAKFLNDILETTS